jgi:hypothetical protein
MNAYSEDLRKTIVEVVGARHDQERSRPLLRGEPIVGKALRQT